MSPSRLSRSKKLKRSVSARTSSAKRGARPPPSRKASKKPGRVYDPAGTRAVAAEAEAWRKEVLTPSLEKMPLRKKGFATDSGIPIPDLLTAADRKTENHGELGLPGRFPFTRGVQPTM